MGTVYYGVCHDCKRWVYLDKFYAWAGYLSVDHADIALADLDDFKDDGWIYRSLRLQRFLYEHNGHRVGVYTEHDWESVDDLVEQFPWPFGMEKLTEVVDLLPSGNDRVVIHTRLGDVYVDDRGKDINCFRLVDGKRVDTVLLGDGAA